MDLTAFVAPHAPGTDVEGLIEAARRIGESPLFEEWVQAIEEFRREHNTIPDGN